MEMRSLRCFVSVAEVLSFSAAAERLGISQSAVSRQVKLMGTAAGRAALRSRRSQGLPNARWTRPSRAQLRGAEGHDVAHGARTRAFLWHAGNAAHRRHSANARERGCAHRPALHAETPVGAYRARRGRLGQSERGARARNHRPRHRSYDERQGLREQALFPLIALVADAVSTSASSATSDRSERALAGGNARRRGGDLHDPSTL